MQNSILITGCGRDGIGSHLALEFYNRGHQVFASNITADEIDPQLLNASLSNAAEDGEPVGSLHTFTLDVTSQVSIDAAYQLISAKTHGTLDILVNNAGIISVMPFADESVDAVKRLYDINVFGAWAMTRTFLPLLVAAQGLVVDLGSIDPVVCPPYFAAYTSSKAAVESISRTIRREFAPLGVRVVYVKSGSVATRLFENCPVVSLPGDSFYAALKEWIEGREFLKLSLSRQTPVEKYCRELVGKLLSSGTEPVVWIGGMSTMNWITSIFAWETAMDSIMMKGSGLIKLVRGASGT